VYRAAEGEESTLQEIRGSRVIPLLLGNLRDLKQRGNMIGCAGQNGTDAIAKGCGLRLCCRS